MESPIPCSNTNYSDVEYFSESEKNDNPFTQYTSSDVETIGSQEFVVVPRKQQKIQRKKNIACKSITRNNSQSTCNKQQGGNLSCSVCEKLFSTFLQLKEHYLNVHQMSGCGHCEDVFVVPADLNCHIQIEHPFIVTCHYCDQRFETESLLVQHFFKTHPNVQPFICVLCNVSFNSSVELSIHEFSVHRRRHCCSICNAVFFSVATLHKHGKSHTKPNNNYKCGYKNCSYVIKSKNSIRKHIQCHLKEKIRYSSVKKILQCNICSKVFASKEKIEKHVKFHFGKKANNTCTLCGLVFTSIQSKISHLKKHKPGKWNFKCGICDFVFPTENSVLLHIQLHTCSEIVSSKCKQLFTKSSDFYCKDCNLYFYDTHSFRIHMKTHDGKRYECSVCQRRLKTKTGLTVHARRHMKVKPYVCTVCDKSFALQRALDVHVCVHHTRAGPFLCDFCGKSFASKMCVQLHTIEMHIKEANYVCSFCSKPFTQKYPWTVHENKHRNIKSRIYKNEMKVSEIKPKNLDNLESFNCSLCGKCFITETSRDLHQKLHSKSGKHKWRKTYVEQLLEEKGNVADECSGKPSTQDDTWKKNIHVIEEDTSSVSSSSNHHDNNVLPSSQSGSASRHDNNTDIEFAKEQEKKEPVNADTNVCSDGTT